MWMSSHALTCINPIESPPATSASTIRRTLTPVCLTFEGRPRRRACGTIAVASADLVAGTMGASNLLASERSVLALAFLPRLAPLGCHHVPQPLLRLLAAGDGLIALPFGPLAGRYAPPPTDARRPAAHSRSA